LGPIAKIVFVRLNVGEGGRGGGGAGLLHCKKELAVFPSPAGMSLIKLSLGGNNFSFFPPRESLVSDIPAGDGKMANSFLQCGIPWISIKELLFKCIFTNFSKKPVISYPSVSLSYFVLAECVVQNIPF
jgi:hypothetical protein